MIKLYNGDCLEIMKDIPDGSIDMILCDLPYGTSQNKWDSVIPFEPLWAQYKRIIKDNGAICLFGQMPFSAALVMSNPSMYRYQWVWDKKNTTGFLNCNRMPMRRHELIQVFYKKKPKYNPQMQKGKPYIRKHARTTTKNYGKYDPEYPTVNKGSRYPSDIISYRGGADGWEITYYSKAG